MADVTKPLAPSVVDALIKDARVARFGHAVAGLHPVTARLIVQLADERDRLREALEPFDLEVGHHSKDADRTPFSAIRMRAMNEPTLGDLRRVKAALSPAGDTPAGAEGERNG